MEQEILFALDDIQAELSTRIGMLSVIADGLTVYSHSSALSGENAERYANTLSIVADMFSSTEEKFRELLDRVPREKRKLKGKESIA